MSTWLVLGSVLFNTLYCFRLRMLQVPSNSRLCILLSHFYCQLAEHMSLYRKDKY